MKKRIGLKISIVVLLLLSILLGAGFTWLTVTASAANQEFVSDCTLDETLETLTSTHKEITADSGGMVYINNEIIVLAEPDATRQDIEAVAQRFNAEIADAITDAGIYQFRIQTAQDLKDLRLLARNITAEAAVENAYISPVSLSEEDDAPAPVYPGDPWKNAKWDTAVPRDANWSVEAIRAPQAWGYLDQLDSVNIGVIDSMVNTAHEDLNIAGAFTSYYDLITGEWSTYQIDASSLPATDHGSHVSGTMVAKWNDVGMSGVMGNKGNLYYSCAYNTRNGSVTNVFYTPYTYVKAISVLLEQNVRAINISQHTNRLIGFAASHGNQNAINYLQSQADLAEALLLRIIQKRQAQGLPDFVICMSAGNSNSTSYYPSDKSTYGYSETPTALQRISGQRVKGGSLAKYNNYLSLIDHEDVAGRIIVVGAAAIDHRISTNTQTHYKYADYSNVGDRVDIAAPGSAVYSCTKNGYDYMTGTSMAAPHVTAAAGLVFAANQELTGPEVKSILLSSTHSRFTYLEGECGMLDLSMAVEKGLLTVENTVDQAINSHLGGLDLCFIVDTTSSMGDDIENTRQNMKDILNSLEEKTADYRVAVVDYRDFPDRAETYAPQDYPAKVQLEFTNDQEAITAAIDNLTLGWGGDYEETVYSGIAAALGLQWREDARKAIIILGDAPALDPEPYTGYTYESILEALRNADILPGYSGEDSAPDTPDTPGSPTTSNTAPTAKPGKEDSLADEEEPPSEVAVYSVITSTEAENFFDKISSDTGGQLTTVQDASQVAGAIQGSIEQIQMNPSQTISAEFGKEFSGEIVEFYRDSEYQFSVQLDEDGNATLKDMPLDSFQWQITRLHRSGTLPVRAGRATSKAIIEPGEWNSILYVIWERHRTITFLIIEGTLLTILLILIIVHIVLSLKDRRTLRRAMKAEAARIAAAAAAVPPPAPAAQMPVYVPPAPEPQIPAETVQIPQETQISGEAEPISQEPQAEEPQAEEPAPLISPSQLPEDDDKVHFCPNCGTAVTEEDLFCPNCGTKIH